MKTKVFLDSVIGLILTALLFGSALMPVQAQGDDLFLVTPDFKFTHLSLEDGLSQTTVISILQDNHGFCA